MVNPPRRGRTLWLRHLGVFDSAAIDGAVLKIGYAVFASEHIVSTPLRVPTIIGRRQYRRSAVCPARGVGANRPIGDHPWPSYSRTSPPPACTNTIPPATSQMLGAAKRATSSSPAATRAHSSAAEPVFRVSQPASSASAAIGTPASRRRTSALTFGVTSSPSNRNLPPAEAW